MRSQDHPEFVGEQDRLNITLAHIRQELRDKSCPTGGDRWVDDKLADIAHAYRERLKDAEQSAYVGRVDVQDDGGREVYYVGKHLLDFPTEARVYSWASPRLGDLFYKGSPDRLLKRVFVIERRDLHTILDEFVHPDLVGTIEEVPFTDSLLHKLLAENRTGRLHDIVATIQEQQYRIIQSPLDRLLVIQGAAGSGKSSIALHRVAYLLFQQRERLNRVIVLGPSRMFMKYIEHILPTLGERNIPQKTVDELLLDILGTRVEYLSMDVSIEMLLSDGVRTARKLVHYRNAQLKGSLRMATLLERYVQILDTVPNGPDQPLICRITQISAQTRQKYAVEAQRKPADIKDLLDRYGSLPLSKRRDNVETQLVASLSSELSTQLLTAMNKAEGRMAPDEWHNVESGVGREVAQQVKHYLRNWRNVNIAVAYRRLLRTPAWLSRAGKDIFDNAELALLAQEAPPAPAPFQFYDLPALAYLKILLTGPESAQGMIEYDHMVVDEAQDLSPMHFKVLSRLMPATSMTVLGDLAQGIYTHSGIDTWEEIEQATEQTIDKEDIKQAYLSTQQITTFANSLLKRMGTDEAHLAEPVARTGPSPTLHGYSNVDDLTMGILGLIRQEQRDQRGSVAVICKTAAGCVALSARLAAVNFGDFHQLTDRDASFTSGVTIIPSYLAKGLEFDTVIVADVDERVYPPDRISARLLYVSLTRASHMLHVCWTGTLTPLLDDTKPIVVLEPMLKASLQRLTLVEYVADAPHLDLTRCVEHLATTEQLYLLADGRVDEAVLDCLFSDTDLRAVARPRLQPKIDKVSEQKLRSWVANLEERAQTDSAAQRQTALLQLVYGLGRNQTRFPHKHTSIDKDNEQVRLADQVVWLEAVYLTIVQEKAPSATARWAQRNECTCFMSDHLKVFAREHLDALINQGFVEEEDLGALHLRVPEDCMRPLLKFALADVHKGRRGGLTRTNHPTRKAERQAVATEGSR